MKLGIDTWAGNQPTNLAAVDGVSFAILRGGQGNWLDRDFESDWQLYRGVHPEWKLSIYHVFDPSYSTAQHMQAIERYYPVGLGLPFVLDVELSRGKSNSEIRQRVSELRIALLERFGKLIIYTGGWWWNVHMLPYPSWQRDQSFWLARYHLAKDPKIFAEWYNINYWYPTKWVAPLLGGGSPDIHQWSGDKFYLPGFSGLLDLNLIRDETWESLTGEPVEPPDVEGEYQVNAVLGLRVRAGAGLEYRILYVMPYQTRVHVYSQSEGWAYLGDGKWCSMQYLTKLS